MMLIRRRASGLASPRDSKRAVTLVRVNESDDGRHNRSRRVLLSPRVVGVAGAEVANRLRQEAVEAVDRKPLECERRRSATFVLSVEALAKLLDRGHARRREVGRVEQSAELDFLEIAQDGEAVLGVGRNEAACDVGGHAVECQEGRADRSGRRGESAEILESEKTNRFLCVRE